MQKFVNKLINDTADEATDKALDIVNLIVEKRIGNDLPLVMTTKIATLRCIYRSVVGALLMIERKNYDKDVLIKMATKLDNDIHDLICKHLFEREKNE